MTDQDITTGAVLKLLRESIGKKLQPEPTTTLFGDLGIWGDDAAELFEHLRDDLGVDLSGFYFDRHFLPEAYSSVELLVLPLVVVARVYRRYFSRRTPEEGEGLIPITVEQLIEAARMKRWPREWSRQVVWRQNDVAAKPP